MRAAPRDASRVRLPEVMRRRSTSLPDPLTGALARDAAAATQRCLACNYKALCDEWLATGKGELTFCPNAAWLAKLRQDSLSFS